MAAMIQTLAKVGKVNAPEALTDTNRGDSREPASDGRGQQIVRTCLLQFALDHGGVMERS